MPLRVFIFFVFFFAWTEAPAQAKKGQALIDSIEAALPKMKEDTNKVKALNKIAQTYEGINPLKCFPYAEQGLKLAEKLNWKKGIANFNNNLGLYISDTGNIALARVYLEKSLALNKEMDSKAMQANNLINIGRTYQFESNFTRSNEYFFKAMTIAEGMKNYEQLGFITGNLFSGYFSQANYNKAIEYGELELKYGNLSGNTRHISRAYQHLSGAKLMLKDTVQSISLLEKGIAICRETGDQVGEADAMLNLALEYPDFRKQIQIMLKVDSIMGAINPNSEISLANMGNLGNAYTQLAKETRSPEKELYLKKAGEYLTNARKLAEQNTSPEYQAHMYYMLADLEEYKSDYKTALAYYKKATLTNDSLFSQEKKNQIAGMEGSYKLTIKENELAISQLSLANQRKTLFGIIAGAAILLAGGIFFYRQSQLRKKTNTTLMVLNNQLDESNKIKARFFGILSHDLRSPISSLVSFLKLVKNDPQVMPVNERDRLQKQLSQSSENLLQTMETMLIWSKDQMDHFKPNITKVTVSELFEYISDFFSGSSPVQFRFQDPDDLVFYSDENYLKVIMQNLTSNALRALHNNEAGMIQWTAKKEADKIILAITDNGPGIGEQQVKALFNDKTTSNAKHGFGFHLIRDLAKAIQYKIDVESEPGRGTTFTLSTLAV